jgi:hypothetical protein
MSFFVGHHEDKWVSPAIEKIYKMQKNFKIHRKIIKMVIRTSTPFTFSYSNIGGDIIE